MLLTRVILMALTMPLSMATTRARPSIERCADDPSLFAARPLSGDEVNAVVTPHPTKAVQVTGPASSFDLSGACNSFLTGLLPSVQLRNGRRLLVSEPPLELIATQDPDTAGSYKAGDLTAVPASLHRLPRPGAHPWRLRSVIDLTRERRLGLWTAPDASMIGVLTCPATDRCMGPEPLITSSHQIRQVDFLPSPDRPGFGGMSLWAHLSATRDALISIRLSY